MTDVLARLAGIERRFGSVVALDGADLELRAGEVHGVLGANGAGKSTLLNVLGGMLRPDAGTIEIGGTPVRLASPRDAWGHGIALVHQHFTLVPALSVLENLALGLRDRSMAAVQVEADSIVARTGLRVPFEPSVEGLGVGDRQRIEILKALLRDPRVLVLDEPTAVLAPEEVAGLFSLLRDLAAQGRAIALVGHKLDEVLGVADRVTVLRAGRSVLSTKPDEHDLATFVRAMVGEGETDAISLGLDEPAWRLDGSAQAEPRESGVAVARLEGVHFEDQKGEALRGVDLSVQAGEVVGVAGVEGNGQRELALVLSGRLAPSRGTVALPDEVGFIPQDRSTEGLIADFDLAENVALALHRAPGYSDGLWMRWPDLQRAAEEIRTRFEVTAASVATRAGALSGGNQQRVIVGRELALTTDLLVAENPTRGLDIAASAFVHAELRRLAAAGVAIVLLSTDLDEVLALSHRVHAIARGRLLRVSREACTREGVGALMLGGAVDD